MLPTEILNCFSAHYSDLNCTVIYHVGRYSLKHIKDFSFSFLLLSKSLTEKYYWNPLQTDLPDFLNRVGGVRMLTFCLTVCF